MIGNDIVDLSAAARESNWRRKGYLEKIFTASEQALIAAAANPHQMVWLLWSMKEAAYKIASRCSGIRVYAPLQLRCTLIDYTDSAAQGRVEDMEGVYFTQSVLNENYIHSIAAKVPGQLSLIKVSLYPIAGHADFNYHATHPQSVSHHGAYLALVYLNLSSLQSAG